MKYIIFNEILWTGIAVDLTEGKRYKVYTGSWIEDDAKTLRNLSHWKGDILNDEDKDYSQTDLSSLEKRLDTLEGLVKELSSNALKTPKNDSELSGGTPDCANEQNARQVYTLELNRDEMFTLKFLTGDNFKKEFKCVDSATIYSLFIKIGNLLNS